MAITKIAQVDVGVGGAGSMDFTSIPQIYTDLLLVVSAKSVGSSGTEMSIRVNGTLGDLVARFVKGDGSSASSQAFSGQSENLLESNSSSVFGSVNIYITNYASATQNKTISSEGTSEGTSTSYQLMTSSINGTNTAVTSLSFGFVYSGTLQQYSSATLYGVTKGSSGGVTVS